ncbi:MAG: hypothetical protein LBU11_12535 [Zoogloeaceae bacterium]|jgi:hypothetical protein|nr:hypothetical protein [Zoogloeaceae bacterium]
MPHRLYAFARTMKNVVSIIGNLLLSVTLVAALWNWLKKTFVRPAAYQR